MRKFVAAVKQLTHNVIRHLYWTTDASTHDPMMQEGLRRAWLDGLVTHDPRFPTKDPSVPLGNN